MRVSGIRVPTLVAIGAVALLLRPVTSQGIRPDVASLAERLVGEVASLGEGDLVRITGGARDMALLEELAVQVRRLGAFPIITVSSDRLDRRMYDDVPVKYDTQAPGFELALAGLVDAEIHVDYSESEGAALAGVSPQRVNTVDSAAVAVAILKNSRGVLEVNLGNEIYPTQALARRFRLSLPELERVFWSGVGVNYEELRAIGERVRGRIDGGTEIRITHANGTDLTLGMSESLVLISDGVISEDEATIGGAARLTWLPAGEVYFVPDAGTANGTLVIERQYFQGRLIEGLRLTVTNGLLESMTADDGIEILERRYNNADPGKEVLGYVDLGINPNMDVPAGAWMVAWMMEGMVTIGFGSNAWAGGQNNTNFSLASHLAGATVTVDGVPLIQDGRLATDVGANPE